MMSLATIQSRSEVGIQHGFADRPHTFNLESDLVQQRRTWLIEIGVFQIQTTVVWVLSKEREPPKKEVQIIDRNNSH